MKKNVNKLFDVSNNAKNLNFVACRYPIIEQILDSFDSLDGIYLHILFIYVSLINIGSQ